MTKEKTVERVMCLKDGRVEVREVLKIIDDDGSILTTTAEARIIRPGDDVTLECAFIQEIAAVVSKYAPTKVETIFI